MPYFLNLAYSILLCAASPWLLWAAICKGKYRAGHAAKLLGLVPRRDDDGPCIWLHAVSAGEVSLLAPLIQRLQRDCTSYTLVLSTTTNTGFEIATRKYPGLTVFYCPLDFSWAVRTALRRIRPDLLVLAELELWPNLIRESKRFGTSVAVVNGRLSEHSARGYARIRWLIRPLLRSMDMILVQTKEYAARFVELGADSEAVCVSGSMKFDGAQANRANEKTIQLAQLAGIEPAEVVFLAGSTQAPEEEFAINAYCKLKEQFRELRLILVPRHPERFHAVAELLDRSGLPYQRRSELDAANDRKARILLVDVMGELPDWWGTAHIGYVGGSMGKRGGQSMIEPAAYGVATSFGPRTHNFRDIVRLLIQREAAVVVHGEGEMTEFVHQCLRDSRRIANLGDRAKQLVSEQMGATEKTFDLLATLLSSNYLRRKAA